MPHATAEPRSRSRPAAEATVVRRAEARLARCLLPLEECHALGHPTAHVRALIGVAEHRLARLRAGRHSGRAATDAPSAPGVPRRESPAAAGRGGGTAAAPRAGHVGGGASCRD